MLTHNFRWSHAAGNQVVPSPWQATAGIILATVFFVISDKQPT